MDYVRRLIDDTLDDYLTGLPAIALEGAKGVGKTATGVSRATTVLSCDRRATRLSLDQDPEVIVDAPGTIFLDEWPLIPEIWSVVRRAVDDGAPPGRFLLAGSAAPSPQLRLHSGAGRIVRLMMRPMTFPERGVSTPSVSFAELLVGNHVAVAGHTTVTTAQYVSEILDSGFPGIRRLSTNFRRAAVESYIDRIVDHDIAEAGGRVQRSATLRGWLAAYGAATATTASYASLLRAATPGESDKPAKETAMVYRDLLQRLWILDPIPAWSPTFAHLNRLGAAPKHHLVDPALAASLVGATDESLICGEGPIRNDETFLGALFESLVAQTVRVLAQTAGARTYHLRTQGGDHEIDLIVERPDHQIVAIEVKVATAVRPNDAAHLTWLKTQCPDLIIDRLIINSGDIAYRRRDGVAVVPLALLGR